MDVVMRSEWPLEEGLDVKEKEYSEVNRREPVDNGVTENK